MNTFLHQIVDELKAEFADQISELCLVVPTRRAVSFLKEALADAYDHTFWAPRMVSIQDFVREQVDWQFPDMMPLVFELYDVYHRRMQQQDPEWEEPFERFYPWGEMLVKDFDEVDKYLVNAFQLFTNVKDLKEIEAFFLLPDEEEYMQALNRFWYTIRGRDEGPTETQEKFLSIWQALYDVYSEFRETLVLKGLAYDGMAYRYLAGKLAEEGIEFPYRKIVFIGFNALSKAEESIMGHLLKEKQAICYWDVDWAYYTPPGKRTRKVAHLTGEEPAKFIRDYHQQWKELDSRLILHDMQQDPKDIYHTGVPLQVGQAQYLGNLLREQEIRPQDYRQTAIVLADENLLFPVLYALPAEIERLNITMGFPLRQTHVYSLLMAIMRLLRNLKWEDGLLSFSHNEVEDILNNPYLRTGNFAVHDAILKEIRRLNLIYVNQDRILNRPQLSDLLTHIFQPPPIDPQKALSDLQAIQEYLAEIFRKLLEDATEREALLEREYIFHFYTQFNQLRDILLNYPIALKLRGFVNLFREVMKKVRIPFEGEPLVGVQVMGFLETRVLDFERVYILAANEGALPDTSTGNSFIPYNLRKGFGLPTFEEKDAIYAYHFYRLLQRTQEIHLIYNTVVNDSGGAKEVSRFIRQIRHFFPKDHRHLQVHERIIATPATFAERPEIRMAQTAETRAILQAKYIEPGNARPQYFSATSLNTYLGCPLRFYYRYVAEIEEPAEVEETMEANTFGSVLHNALEYVYEGYEGRTLSAEDHAQLARRLSVSMARALDDNHLGKPGDLQGQNYLLRQVIQTLCERILKHDANNPPFVVRSLEDKKSFFTTFDTGKYQVRINGTFDRVDYLPERESVRILDYKTGRVNLGTSRTTLDDLFQDNKQKEAFQGYLYAWLYARRYPEEESQLVVGYYTARQLRDGIVYLGQGKRIPVQVLHEFEDRLKALINRIFEEDFAQTEDERKCRICPYREICNR